MGQLIERGPGQHLMIGTGVVVTLLRIDGATASIQVKHADSSIHVHTLSMRESRMVGPRTGVTFRSVRGRVAVFYVMAPADVAIVVPAGVTTPGASTTPNRSQSQPKGRA